MWKLVSVEIENIVSFRDAKFNISQGVATLIFGRNLDNASQPRNGSGKSSLVEAIAFGLTGEPLREKVTVDEIINDAAEEAYIGLKLENDYNHTTFIISRNLSRKSPQVIECHKFDAEGNEIETDKTIQATVADYNKFILEEIGLSKDDIYSNYILCDDKYRSFFRCSDKDKKEIINRFSNGYMVDESIEKVKADLVPIQEELTKANNQVVSIQGSIDALESEIDNAAEKNENAKQERERKLAEFDAKIAECRAKIRETEENKVKAEKRLKTLKMCQDLVAKLEETESSLGAAYDDILKLVNEHNIGTITDFKALAANYNETIARLKNDIKNYETSIEEAKVVRDECKKSYDTFCTDYKNKYDDNAELTKSERESRKNLEDQIAKFDEQLDKIEAEIKEKAKEQKELSKLLVDLQTILHGTITCPNCQHKFFIGNNEDVATVKKKHDETQVKIQQLHDAIEKSNQTFDEVDAKAQAISDQIKATDKKANERLTALNAQYKKLMDNKKKLDDAESKITSIQKDMDSTKTEIERNNGKVEVLRSRLFGEITGILEGKVIQGEGYISQIESDITYTKGQITQYKKSKEELANSTLTDFAVSIKKSLEEYGTKLEDAQLKASDIQKEYNTLKEQEVNFTMFKSYLANRKIEAFSAVMNDFLEQIGSDIRIQLEGFTMTKTGKLRDKISVTVLRDGISCGSFYKRSGGEKARVNLACILALHALTNADCEAGKGLDLLIVDEILDKSDEMGITTYCDALNKLQQTTLMITQGAVLEGYQHKVLVTKEQGISKISNS